MATLQTDNKLDKCDICNDNPGVREKDVQNEETGEMATAWLCRECIRRMERYNAGDESAFDDVTAGNEQE